MALKIKEGDVLLFSNGGMLPTLTVQAGQKLLSLGRGLDSSIIHVGIVSKKGEAFSCRIGFPDIQVVHAISAGIVQQRLDWIVKTGYRSALIYRAPAALQSVRKDAAAIARRWATPAQNQKSMSFSVRKALMAGFGSSSYGTSGQARAAEYHQHANTPGGPPSLHDASLRNKSIFCSMLVVATYQAALGPQATATHMPIDARNCTPMMLADFLLRKGFEQVGHVFMVSSSPDIHVVDGRGNMIDAPMLFFT